MKLYRTIRSEENARKLLNVGEFQVGTLYYYHNRPFPDGDEYEGRAITNIESISFSENEKVNIGGGAFKSIGTTGRTLIQNCTFEKTFQNCFISCFHTEKILNPISRISGSCFELIKSPQDFLDIVTEELKLKGYNVVSAQHRRIDYDANIQSFNKDEPMGAIPDPFRKRDVPEFREQKEYRFVWCCDAMASEQRPVIIQSNSLRECFTPTYVGV